MLRRKRLQEHSFLIQHSDNSLELFPGVQRVTASNQEMVISTLMCPAARKQSRNWNNTVASKKHAGRNSHVCLKQHKWTPSCNASPLASDSPCFPCRLLFYTTDPLANVHLCTICG